MQIHVYDHAQQVGQAAATLLAAQLISKQFPQAPTHLFFLVSI